MKIVSCSAVILTQFYDFQTAPPPATVGANTSLHNSNVTTPLKPYVHNSPSPPIVPPYPPPTVPYPLHNNTEFSEGKHAFIYTFILFCFRYISTAGILFLYFVLYPKTQKLWS